MIRFADSHPVSGAYQFGEIHVQVTKRKPQFLDAFPLPVDAFGGGNAQNAGSGDGISLCVASFVNSFTQFFIVYFVAIFAFYGRTCLLYTSDAADEL